MGDTKGREGDSKCTLCEGKARMYCESDEAMLCWDCDARVHGANFLVAKHTRVLLCRSCQTPTTWKACGPRLTPSVSLCSHCCFGGGNGGNHGLLREETRQLENEEEGEEVQNRKEEDEEGDNQVVPWKLMPVTVTITPPVASSSSSDGSTVLKRARNDQADQSSSPTKDHEPEPTSTLMQLDRIKRTVGEHQGLPSKEGRHPRLRRERKRSSALTQTSVFVSQSQQKAAFVPTAVSDEPTMSCSSARLSLSPTD